VVGESGEGRSRGVRRRTRGRKKLKRGASRSWSKPPRFATVIRCWRDVAALPATSHGDTCASECCKRQRIELFGFLDPVLASSFPTRLHGFPAVSVCRTLTRPTHPLLRFAAPPESLESPPARRSCPGTFPGLSSLIATSARGVHARRLPKPALFRPRRFSRPRRLAPPRTLRVYFTPQPRPGFALQGFSLVRSRTGSSPAVALLSFTRCPCP